MHVWPLLPGDVLHLLQSHRAWAAGSHLIRHQAKVVYGSQRLPVKAQPYLSSGERNISRKKDILSRRIDRYPH